MKRFASIALVALALSGCGTVAERYADAIYQTLDPIPEPGEVVATDIAFARTAREDGQWTAFRRYAADGAIIHGRQGPIEAGPWLAQQTDPPAAVQWTPTAIWTSCDGATAVSFGTFAEPDGNWGYYTTVWERQRNGTYRWVYDVGAPNAALTERRAEENAARRSASGEIVVEGIPDIRADFAQCTDAAPPPYPSVDYEQGTRGDTRLSADRSLAWSWQQSDDGARSVAIDIVKEGDWEEAMRLVITADNQAMP